MKLTISNIMDNIKELTPLPVTAIKFSEAVADENSEISDFVQILKMDQAITANVLRLANSASSGSSREISDVKSAVIRLGGKRILTDIVSKYFAKSMSQEILMYGYEESNLWRHSVAAALATNNIAKLASKPIPIGSFVATLMHDIGKLVISRNIDTDTITKINQFSSEGVTFLDAEKEILGFTHCEAGFELATKWKLPHYISLPIGEHHNPTIESDIVDIVKLSNYIAKALGEGVGSEGMQFKIGDKVFENIGISITDFEIICADTSIDFLESIKEFS